MQKKTKSGPKRPAGGIPTREEILAFIQQSQTKVGKREVARAFDIKGAARIPLKRLLQEMADEGLLSGNKKALKGKGSLGPVAVLDIVARDAGGDLVAEPATWDGTDGARPRVLVLAGEGRRGAGEPELGVGDRILAKIADADHGEIRLEARPIKRLPKERRRLVGIFRKHDRPGGEIAPVDKKELRSWPVKAADAGDAKNGDLVRFELSKSGRFAVPEARIVEVLGNPADQRQISLIAVHAHGIPDEFPARVLAELDELPSLTLKNRTDLRALPLLTIDPVDARDHDDAVHAEPDADPSNPDGFIVTVAIADVAHYIHPATNLDREARLRGNSCYFPDRVVPMLPERISNDLCSLRELEDRPCLAVRMTFNARGEKQRHAFSRAMMRSAAKLSYQEAQAAIDGNVSAKCAPHLETALRPLWAAYAKLAQARDARGPLDLNLPERKIVLNAEGRVARVIVPERLTAHRLIEEMMIQANVAAAETLEEYRTACVYRVHAAPSKEKLTALRDFLESVEIDFPSSGTLRPSHFNRILAQAKAMPVADLVNEVVLRSQAQAEYAHENYGHFGLNLRKYAHFTSPIRRYADLVVHRALVRAMKFGSDGLSDGEIAVLTETCQAISDTERRAMMAERETSDRLIAAHLADRIGAEFDARITGVTRAGLFVRLKDTGADGLVPISTLGDEFFRHDETQHALVGERSGEAYRLGDDVRVKLIEAIPMAGALRFEMLSRGKRGHVATMPKSIRGKRRLKGRRHPQR